MLKMALIIGKRSIGMKMNFTGKADQKNGNFLKLVLLALSLCLSGEGFALDLKLTRQLDRSDGNVCGDVNRLQLYDLHVDSVDRDRQGTLVISPAALEVIAREAALVANLEEPFHVGSVRNAAVKELEKSLHIARDASTGHWVQGSCQDDGILESFGVVLTNGKIVPKNQSPEITYLTMVLGEGGGIFRDIVKVHVMLNAKTGRAAIFSIY